MILVDMTGCIFLILPGLLRELPEKLIALIIMLVIFTLFADEMRARNGSTRSHVLTRVAEWLGIPVFFLVILLVMVMIWARPVGLVGLIYELERIARWLGIYLVLTILGLLVVAVAIGAALPVKKLLTRSYVIAKATPGQVWAALSDAPHLECGINLYEELPSKRGHRMWVMDGMLAGKTTWEEVESDPPFRLVRIGGGKCFTYLIEPVSEGSRLTIAETKTRSNPIERFFERYLHIYHAYLQGEARYLGIHFRPYHVFHTLLI